MKKGTFCFLFLLGIVQLYSQNNIAIQSFESTGDTWGPLTFSTAPCTNGNDVWDYTTALTAILPNDGLQFWGVRDLDGSCGGNGYESITFPNINISSFSNVTFSFDYYAIGLDNNEDLRYELFYDGVSQGEVIVVNGTQGNSDNTNGWLTETISISSTVTNVSLNLSTRNNNNNDRAAFDNVRLMEAAPSQCDSATSLTVFENGTSSGNESSADSSTTTPSSMANTSCDSFTSNLNLDLFYTFTVPAGETSINVLTGGTTGSDINVAVWDACNGTEIFCDNTDSAFHQITGLTPGETYILQVWHDAFNAGAFTIALETPLPPPTNSDCFNSIALTVGSSNTENLVTSSNEGASNSGELPNPSCGVYGGRDVWFTTQVPASGILTVETQTAGSGIDTAMAIYTGSCGNLTELDCNDDINWPSNPYSQINITGLPNTTIYVRVYSYNNSSTGNFNIVAYSPPCPFTTTWNGNNWNNGNPNSFTSAVLNGDYDTAIDGNIDSCNCTINTGSTVNIRANNYISIEKDLSVSGNLQVQHEGSLVMVEDDGTINSTGTINVHKTTSPFNQYDYIYWSSPTVNETVGSALANSEPSRIYQWNNINGWIAAGSTTIMDPGTGLIAMGSTAGTFPQTQSVIFDGLPNTGVIETPMVKNPDPLYTYLDWNLIGNPYPSALDATSFLDDPLNSSVVNGTVYLWTHNTEISSANSGGEKYNYSSNDYASFTPGTGGVAAKSGGSAPDGFIASGQGFFIQAASNGNVTFNNSMRVTGNNDQFYKANKIEEEKDRIWLNLSNNKGAFNQILIGFIDGATDGIDRLYDGPKFGGSYISFYSIIDEKNFVIQGRSHIKEEEKVKLGLYSYIEQNDNLKISINKIEGNLSEYDIYLTDKLLNIVHNLKDESYTFIPEEKGVFDERFELFFTKSSTLGLDDSSATIEELILINKEDHIEIRTSNGTNISNLRVYNILGQDISNLYPNKNNTKIQTKNIPNGTVLILNAILDNNITVTKKFLIY